MSLDFHVDGRRKPITNSLFIIQSASTEINKNSLTQRSFHSALKNLEEFFAVSFALEADWMTVAVLPNAVLALDAAVIGLAATKAPGGDTKAAAAVAHTPSSVQSPAVPSEGMSAFKMRVGRCRTYLQVDLLQSTIWQSRGAH